MIFCHEYLVEEVERTRRAFDCGTLFRDPLFRDFSPDGGLKGEVFFCDGFTGLVCFCKAIARALRSRSNCLNCARFHCNSFNFDCGICQTTGNFVPSTCCFVGGEIGGATIEWPSTELA